MNSHTVVIVDSKTRALICTMPNIVADSPESAALKASDEYRAIVERCKATFKSSPWEGPELAESKLAVAASSTHDWHPRTYELHADANVPGTPLAVAVVVPHPIIVGSLLPG
jgi:hypothetical protein